jgi:RNA polymerase sigma factor (sigma-70 family)
VDKLVIQYKKKTNKDILDQIFKILHPTIIEKSKYVFYEQTFGYRGNNFKLVNSKQIELNDIIQQLSLEIIEWINNFKLIAPFSHYLNQCLEGKKWKPKFINVTFLKSLNTQSIYQETGEGEEVNITDDISTSEPINVEFEFSLTKIEQEIWELIQGDLNLSQQEIADELDISKMTVSRVIARIRGKLKK